MKICPQCSSKSLRYSHARTPFENFLKHRLGFHFYRCSECNWRGKKRPKKIINKYSGKKSIWVVLGIYVLAVLLVLFIVFFVIGVGGSNSTQPPL